jgi:hypothetical protein
VEDLCWSLVSRDNKTLDLAAETVQEARLWKEALAAILRELGGPRQPSAQPTTANPVALRLKRAVAEGRRDEVASLLASRQIETDAALDESGDTALLRAAKRAKFPTSKAPFSAVFHSFRLIFGRAIISRSGLEAWMFFS